MADIINPLYHNQKTVSQIQQHFMLNKELPSIQLQQFFSPQIYAAIKAEVRKLSYKKDENMLQHRYAKAVLSKPLLNLFGQGELQEFINKVLKEKVKMQKIQASCFGWKDYTLLNDHVTQKTGIDFFFDCTEDWHEGWGGSIVYVDGTGNYTYLPPTPNTVIIVRRKTGVQKFVQYINHHAQKKKRVQIDGFLL